MKNYTGTNNLGETQQGVLKALVEHHTWSPGCGWLWSTQSATARVLDALVRRGLVTTSTKTRTMGPPSFRYDVEVTTYLPTEQAVAWYVEQYPASAQRRGITQEA